MSEMKPIERIRAVCKGELPDRVPFVPASREFGMKYAGFPLSKAYEDPDCYIDAQIRLVEEFGQDAVWDIWATPVVDEALGATLVFPEDDSPFIGSDHFLKNIEDWDSVKRVNPLKDGRMPYMISLVEKLKKRVGPDVPVIAWISQPFRTACMLHGEAELYRDLLKKPGDVLHLIERVYDSLLDYGKALIDAGADIICTSNPVANAECISKRAYAKFSHPFTERIFGDLKSYGNVLTWFHTCGRWNDRFDLVTEENVDVLHLDKVDLAEFKASFSDKAVACGNLRTSEVLLHGSAEDARQETINCINSAKEGGRFILGANCAVPRDTPAENMRAVVSALNEFGYY